MTTIDGLLVPPDEPASDSGTDAPTSADARRPRVWLRIVLSFVVGFGLALAVAGAGLYAYDASHEGLVLPGVHIGGVDVSAMSYSEAAAAVHAAYDRFGEGTVVVKTTAGDITIPFSDFDRRPDVGPLIDEAMAVGRTGTVLERALSEVRLALQPTVIQPKMVFDDALLGRWIQRGVEAYEQPAIDASITMGPKGIEATPPQFGRTYDAAVATTTAVAAVQQLDAPAEVVVTAPATVTVPERGYGEVLRAKRAAGQVIDDLTITLGKKSWTIKASAVRRWLSFETAADGSTRPVVDQAAIAKSKSLTRIAKIIKRPAVSAKYLKTRGGKVVGVVAAENGRKMNVDATVQAIADALAARATGGEVEAVKLKTAKILPKLTTEEATKKGPLMVALGSWKTWFPVSERNAFGANIWLPAKTIDGMVLRPGQRFEWWSAIGPVTPARGYGMGGFIAGNHTDPTGALGGGMCSSSTTLFNAALRAGLRMGARDNHKYYIDRYPLGLDATVSKTRGGGGQTMSFTNDMKTPIVIRSFRYVAGGRGWVQYEIWGIPDGRKVSLSKPRVWNVRKAGTSVVYTSRLPKGVREQVEYPANGMSVSVTRVVRSKSGRVMHRDTYNTNYVLWQGRIEVGR